MFAYMYYMYHVNIFNICTYTNFTMGIHIWYKHIENHTECLHKCYVNKLAYN